MRTVQKDLTSKMEKLEIQIMEKFNTIDNKLTGMLLDKGP
jgi:hypothetical protein